MKIFDLVAAQGGALITTGYLFRLVLSWTERGIKQRLIQNCVD